MNINLFTQTLKVFVADVSDDMKNKKKKLCTVLSKARIEPVCAPDNCDETTLENLLKSTNCSIHIVGDVDIYNSNGEGYNTNAGMQYRTAKKHQNEDFKMFVWNPKGKINTKNKYINNIRRDIVENTIYSSTSSPIVFVEDLRNIISTHSEVDHVIEEKDVFFIYSDLDKNTANEILNMVEDIMSVAKLPITMNSETDYTEYIKNQLKGCKIGVIYYDYAGDWAVSFARQIWKDTGGQSAKTPIQLIGNAEHANTEDTKILKGILPTTIREVSLIPLDIKVFLDNVNEKTTKPE